MVNGFLEILKCLKAHMSLSVPMDPETDDVGFVGRRWLVNSEKNLSFMVFKVKCQLAHVLTLVVTNTLGMLSSTNQRSTGKSQDTGMGTTDLSYIHLLLVLLQDGIRISEVSTMSALIISYF